MFINYVQMYATFFCLELIFPLQDVIGTGRGNSWGPVPGLEFPAPRRGRETASDP